MREILRTLYYGSISTLARLLSPGRYRAYLRSTPTRKLQIGAGPSTAAGWLVTDIAPPRLEVGYLDATRRYPFPSASFDYVHSEHMIEHVPHPGGASMLAECFRVLKPGGRIRIATPDFRVLLNLYLNRDDADVRRYVRWMTARCIPEAPAEDPLFVINKAVRSWGHQFLYDAPALEAALARAGFVDIRRHAVGESDDAALSGIERHGVNVDDEWINRYETMVFEARKPAG